MVFYVFSRIYCVVWIVLNISSIEVVQDCTKWEQWVLTCSLDSQNPPNKLETSQDMFRVWQKVRDSQPQGTTSLSRNHLNPRNTAPCNKSHEGHKWQHLFFLQLYLLYLLQTKLDVSMFLGKAGGHVCFFCFFSGGMWLCNQEKGFNRVCEGSGSSRITWKLLSRVTKNSEMSSSWWFHPVEEY